MFWRILLTSSPTPAPANNHSNANNMRAVIQDQATQRTTPHTERACGRASRHVEHGNVMRHVHQLHTKQVDTDGDDMHGNTTLPCATPAEAPLHVADPQATRHTTQHGGHHIHSTTTHKHSAQHLPEPRSNPRSVANTQHGADVWASTGSPMQREQSRCQSQAGHGSV